MVPDMPAELRRKVDELPRRPGVYLMKDARQEVIYVGKAKDLRARVRTYFLEGRDEARLITRRIDRVADIDTVVVGSEQEAYLLESNFIKQFRPRYNVVLADGKTFPSIRLDRSEPWPRPVLTRKIDDDDALYFGPYASARAARETLRVLNEVFPLRKCKISQCMARTRPCIYGEMGRCSAPCSNAVSEEDYAEMVDEVVLLLRGQSRELLERMRALMDRAAGALEFERAAAVRDRIEAIERTLESQRVASSQDQVDRDVFGVCRIGAHVCVSVLFVRAGNVSNADAYRFPAELDSPAAILESFLGQFYARHDVVPDEVVVPVDLPDADGLAAWLGERRGRRVRVIQPKRGHRRELLDLATRNAEQAERAATGRNERRRLELEDLQELLGLRALPRVVECYDISTLQGREAVGSRVVFRDGEPDKSSYRRYRIRTVEGQDDFAMMREVLERRFARAASGEEEAPDLVLVDGGKGQLGVATAVLEDLGVEHADVASLAKERRRGGRSVRVERVFLPGRAQALPVPEGGYAFRLVVRLRDEAHRFAVAYHRKLRAKAAFRSPLLDIPGVGEKTARRLMERFGGLNKVAAATPDELKGVRGVSDALAARITAHFRDGGERRGAEG